MRNVSPSFTISACVLFTTILLHAKTSQNLTNVSAFTMPTSRVDRIFTVMAETKITSSTMMAATRDAIAPTDANVKAANVKATNIKKKISKASSSDGITTPEAPVKNTNTPKKVKLSSNSKKSNNNNKKVKKGKASSKRFNKSLPLSKLTLGSKISGVVAGISPFGAFIKTPYKLKPGRDHGYALLHISQIQDTIVDDVSNVLKVGQKLNNLRVISINYAKGAVSLSMRSPRPKRKDLSEMKVGDMIYGKVRNITPYGAFVDVGCKINLLLHKSRISKLKVENIADFIQVGEKVNVRVISIDQNKKTLAGSMLDLNTDLYLNKRKKNEEKRTQTIKPPVEVNEELNEKDDSDIFDDAMRDLSEIFQIEE